MTLVERADDHGRTRQPSTWPTTSQPLPRADHESAEAVANQVDHHRAVGIRQTLDLVANGQPGLALYRLVRSVERQAKIAGLDVRVRPACPCDGRCRKHSL